MNPGLETEYIDRINEAAWTRTTYIQPHEYVVYERYPELCALISGLINEGGLSRNSREVITSTSTLMVTSTGSSALFPIENS